MVGSDVFPWWELLPASSRLQPDVVMFQVATTSYLGPGVEGSQSLQGMVLAK